jgi:hypothetical protein
MDEPLFDRLQTDIVQVIAEFHSLEALIYLFPHAGLKKVDQEAARYTYTWACNLNDSRIRIRVLLHLLQQQRVPESTYLIDHCAQKGNISLLQSVFRICQLQPTLEWNKWYSHRAVDWASQYGCVHVLDWLLEISRQLHIPFRFSQHALDSASKYGQLHVLHWWKKQYLRNPSLVLQYSKDAVDCAHSPEVMDWWLEMHRKYDVDLRYSTRSIDRCKDTRILDWWLHAHLTYGLRLKYKMTSINTASANGDTYLLDWWVSRTPLTSVPLKYSEHTMDAASANGHVHVLDWWLAQWEERQYTLRYTAGAVDLASENGEVKVLEWWFARSQEGRVLFKRTVQAVNQASRNGHVHVLDWWIHLYRRYRVPFLYDSWAIEWALDNPRVMQWWTNTCSKYSFVLQPIHWNRYRIL